MARRAVSLGLELVELEHVVDAARLLAAELATEQFGHLEDHRRAPRLIEAVLGLATARLELLQRAIGGQLDPRWLAAASNVPLPAVDDAEQQDLVLEPWSPGRRIKMAELDLERARKVKRRKR